MDKETVKTVAQYYGIYMYISEEPRSRDDCATFATKELKMPKSTAYKLKLPTLKSGFAP